MNKSAMQTMLPLIEQPSRYLGTEINAIRKDHQRVKLRVALAFPDLYEIGMSHFGLQILYHILNAERDILAERVFAPGIDLQKRLQAAGIKLASLESQVPLDQFDIIGFSILYELNYTNILSILELADIPWLASERDFSEPLIIGGGPCTCNPEPLADIFDAIVVGDGEEVILAMAGEWMAWREEAGRDKDGLLRRWSRIEGVYVPSFFQADVDGDGFQVLRARYGDYHTVKRAVVADLDGAAFPESPILPFGRTVHDRLRLEISRGCTRGCRFCQAGMIYRPLRERSVEKLMQLAEKSIRSTGYEELSLLSLSTGDYGCLDELLSKLMARWAEEHVAVSFPSLRAGSLTRQMMTLIKTVRKTGFTIAPEAGSQRLRDAINKNLTEEEIVNSVQNAFVCGWQTIKLYFMIGLPGERDDDLREMVKLVRKLAKIRGKKGRKGRLNVSVTTFIPKSHTPFQWAGQIALEESSEKIDRLRDALKMSGVHFKWQNPKASMLEGLWARGDRRLLETLRQGYQRGCRFDGWSDMLRHDQWLAAMAASGIDADFYTIRTRSTEEPLPWDHIDCRISKSYLRQEREKAAREMATEDCRFGSCSGCGACDFKRIEPRVAVRRNPQEGGTAPRQAGPEGAYRKVEISYSKRGQGIYFGHLEMVNIFLRALRRGGIALKYSQGFHPKPKISFEDPLPIGMASMDQRMVLTVSERVGVEEIAAALGIHLPEGLKVEWVRIVRGRKMTVCDTIEYRISAEEDWFRQEAAERFEKADEWSISRQSAKGRLKKIDLKDMVVALKILNPKQMRLTLKCGGGATVRPNQVIKDVFGLSDDRVRQVQILKCHQDKGAQGRECTEN